MIPCHSKSWCCMAHWCSPMISKLPITRADTTSMPPISRKDTLSRYFCLPPELPPLSYDWTNIIRSCHLLRQNSHCQAMKDMLVVSIRSALGARLQVLGYCTAAPVWVSWLAAHSPVHMDRASNTTRLRSQYFSLLLLSRYLPLFFLTRHRQHVYLCNTIDVDLIVLCACYCYVPYCLYHSPLGVIWWLIDWSRAKNVESSIGRNGKAQNAVETSRKSSWRLVKLMQVQIASQKGSWTLVELRQS